MRVCMAQLNPTVGNVASNVEKIEQIIREAAKEQADLIVLPELFLTGYPPRDLLLRTDFRGAVQTGISQLKALSRKYPEIGIICGVPLDKNGQLFNSAVVVYEGDIIFSHDKIQLTEYEMFSETRYFTPGSVLKTFSFRGEVVGLSIGNDLNHKEGMKSLVQQGANLIVNLAAVPFTVGVDQLWFEQLREFTIQSGVPFVCVNQVGGNDELIFMGNSLCLDETGQLVYVCPQFLEAVQIVDTDSELGEEPIGEIDETAQIYQALVVGVRDYIRKSGLGKVLIGLSGGLDSAVVCAIAVKALGADNVWGITMPGPYSSPGSVEDSRLLAENLGIKFDVIPISSIYDSFLSTLKEQFTETKPNVAEENIQARVRGSILMALSNKFGGMVLTNSNKSELAIGYCTLYGDMSGGLGVIGDVYKTMVYKIAYYINREKEVIPWETIEKPPSAELRPNQRDDESLPPYEILDAIIQGYLYDELSVDKLVAQGFARETVEWVTRTIDRNDYKRRQAAPILRVTSPVTGPGRNMPLAAVKGPFIK